MSELSVEEARAGMHASVHIAELPAKDMAVKLASHGIRVNALVPGGVEAGQNETFKAQYSNRVPLGRMARADEVVGAAVFLASDGASYITGQSVFVDGGLSAR